MQPFNYKTALLMSDPNDLIPTRATLLHRLKNWNDQLSWQDFFDTYWKLIYGVARQAGLADTEAQDVVQETMLSVAKHMPDFKYDPAVGSFKAWLLNMTKWRIIDQQRKRARAQNHDPLPADHESGTGFADGLMDPSSLKLNQIWDKEWSQTLLDAAITRVKRQVDPQKYQLFDFYVNKEWVPEKVAKMFGVSVDQVYLAKHRITDLIRDEVKRLEKETG